jgi:hypothetical protein
MRKLSCLDKGTLLYRIVPTAYHQGIGSTALLEISSQRASSEFRLYRRRTTGEEATAEPRIPRSFRVYTRTP